MISMLTITTNNHLHLLAIIILLPKKHEQLIGHGTNSISNLRPSTNSNNNNNNLNHIINDLHLKSTPQLSPQKLKLHRPLVTHIKILQLTNLSNAKLLSMLNSTLFSPLLPTLTKPWTV